MRLDIFKLYFTGPIHLSKGKLNTYESSDDVLHSDTIKSALFVNALQLFDDIDDKEAFFDSFQVSSAFPFTSDGYFFPKPLHFSPSVNTGDRKKFKKRRYIHQSAFEKIIAGEKALGQSGVLNIDEPQIWVRYNTQRVVIDRLDSRGVPFYLEKLFPCNSETSGLYFIVNCQGENATKRLKQIYSAARLLGNNGIGLQKGLGNGFFKVEQTTLMLNTPAEGQVNAGIALSLYHPSDKNEISQVALEKGAYDFTQRGGWIASPEDDRHRSIRKKSIYMFKEGSVFPIENTQNDLFVLGKKMDVTPDAATLPSRLEHVVWREGTCLFLPLKL